MDVCEEHNAHVQTRATWGLAVDTGLPGAVSRCRLGFSVLQYVGRSGTWLNFSNPYWRSYGSVMPVQLYSCPHPSRQ